MDKFGRNYELTIQTDDAGSTIVITPPFTLEFDITRNTLTSANVAQLRVYNLSAVKRNQVRFNISNYGTYRGVILKAGYGEDIPVVFAGNISQARSVREGVNFITQIECYDGGFAFLNGVTSLSFPKNISMRDVIRNLAGNLPRTSVGTIGNYEGPLGRGAAYSGNPIDAINGIAGPNALFIDKEVVNVLKTEETIPGRPVEVNAKSGLLGTPVLEQYIVRFDMLFEPQLNIGYQVNLTSLTEENFNGLKKITAVKHRGMISDAVCGSVVTTGEFFNNGLLVSAPNG